MRMSHHERAIRSPDEIPLARREFLKGVTSLGALALLSCFLPSCSPRTQPTPVQLSQGGEKMALPEPRKESDVSLEEALLRRRSIRSYSGEALTLEGVSQLLWAAQGVTDDRGFRTAPSAGALYPLEVHVVVGDVQSLPPGVFRYEPEGHQLVREMDGDRRPELANAALGQGSVKEGTVVFVLTGVYERTTRKYGNRGARYVHMEVGHAAQNLCLQATAMDLGAVTIGAFHDERVSELLSLPEREQPLYIVPVGRK